MITVNLPDGTTLQFPEGTDRETMRAATAKFWAKRQGETAKPAEAQASLQSDVAIAPASAVDPTPDEEAAAELKAHTAFEAANPTLAGKYKPGDRLPRAGDTVMGAGGGGRSGGARYTVQPYLAADMARAKDTFGGTASDMMAGPISAAKAFGGGLTGGDSPSRAYLDADPAAGKLPGWIKAPVAAAGDIGGMLLSGLGAGVSGGIGLATELVPGQTDASEQRLGNDLLGMASVAVPELAGVSSLGGFGARMGAKAATKAPAVAERAAGLGPARAATVAPMVAKSGEDVAALVVRASGAGRGAEIAQKRLAVLAEVNPEAKAAVDRLGIELPPDVLSDNPAVRQFGGAVRSVVGSEDAAAWEGTVRNAIAKADEVMNTLGSGRDIASVSDNVKAAITSTRDTLRKEAGEIYNRVTEIVGPRTKVELPQVRAWLEEKIADVGGIDRLPAGLRGFVDMLAKDRPVTFAFLQQEKAELGASAYKPGSRYIDVGTKDARDLQRAMAEDQRAAVALTGDDALRAEYEAAQAMTAKQKALEEQITAAFGKDQQGSIATALTGAITGGRSGNIAGLNRVLSIIPEDMVPEALATAIASATRSKRAAEPGFGFAEFAKTFGDIRENGPVFKRITDALGKEKAQLLDDLLIASRRITDARGNVMGTGKANQARDMLNRAAETVVSKVLANPVGRRVSQMAATGAAGAVGGVGGAAVAFPLVEALTRSSPKAVEAAGRMFRSDAFQRFANEAAAAPEVSAATINNFANHGAFRQWARAVALPDPRGWLAEAVSAPPTSVKVAGAAGAAATAQQAGAQ